MLRERSASTIESNGRGTQLLMQTVPAAGLNRILLVVNERTVRRRFSSGARIWGDSAPHLPRRGGFRSGGFGISTSTVMPQAVTLMVPSFATLTVGVSP